MESEERPKKKFICLHCGHIFESDKEAPHCPNCRRKRVIPLDVFKASVEKHRDILEKEGILPKVEPESAKDAVDVDGHSVDGVTAGSDVSSDVAVNPTVSDATTTDVVTSDGDVSGDVVGDVDVIPESDVLLSKYLSDLDGVDGVDNVEDVSNANNVDDVSNVDEVELGSAVKPMRKVERIRKPSGFSVPLKALFIIGLMILVYWWWTSRQSKPEKSTTSEVEVTPRSSVLDQINRNLGHRVLG